METTSRTICVCAVVAALVLACSAVTWAQPLLYAPDRPPIAASVQLSTPDANGDVVVTGLPGAVPGGSVVVLATLDTGHVVVVDAAADGSFSAPIFGPLGASIMVKADPFGVAARTFVQQSAGQVEPFSDALAPVPGTILRVPDPPATPAGIPFSGTNRVNFTSPLPVFT